MENIPFLRASTVPVIEYLDELKEIDASHIYTNYGPINQRFEQTIMSGFFQNRGAVTTVANATLGLMTAIQLKKRKKGKYALMPSFTFPATPLAAIWCGLEPYFIDIGIDDWYMDKTVLWDKIEELKKEVAIVVPYATFGSWMNLEEYEELEKKGVPVVVDAAPGFGLMNGGMHYGQDFSGMIVYSFHATKPFGIGEGGLIYSKNEEDIQRIKKMGNFGFDTNRECTMMGFNCKMSEYAAAIGIATMKKWGDKLKERTRISEWYKQLLQSNGLMKKGWQLQKTEAVIQQFMPILCPEEVRNIQVIEELKKQKIEARLYFSPSCHQQVFFRNYKSTDLIETNKIAKRIVSLPLWEGMTKEIVEQIVICLGQKVVSADE
ncbi:aminotransferase class I/II-fold pyridoxal phosphate-dependent enzyme [Bacillus pacificus]|uniref:aminotransferase class I/II-fold pyridoxal phosphate-dependent enzyme n=1 Tax=Bacillus pacificus TaxID=2026187 RepID=UPI0027E83D0C|nr:aminotransferase class I/II-fold pyridoxal phosphate-dependent enzyme [Bacillus pacificus]MDQ7234471.1 aminotransferase class I/II-fold pyridoxal phosphate-dependent enzyme [Bacillus pacificus]MDQ7239634.1 aminotransferase class I/II-fold pyridoxal phosphate-dependent enzyme [Bacillus pacificus]